MFPLLSYEDRSLVQACRKAGSALVLLFSFNVSIRNRYFQELSHGVDYCSTPNLCSGYANLGWAGQSLPTNLVVNRGSISEDYCFE